MLFKGKLSIETNVYSQIFYVWYINALPSWLFIVREVSLQCLTNLCKVSCPTSSQAKCWHFTVEVSVPFVSTLWKDFILTTLHKPQQSKCVIFHYESALKLPDQIDEQQLYHKNFVWRVYRKKILSRKSAFKLKRPSSQPSYRLKICQLL